MGKSYRLDILNDGRCWGSLLIDHPHATQAAQELLQVLRDQPGYTVTVYESDSERRVLESTPDGVRILFKEPLFKPVDSIRP